jgi:hypothetical protein
MHAMVMLAWEGFSAPIARVAVPGCHRNVAPDGGHVGIVAAPHVVMGDGT